MQKRTSTVATSHIFVYISMARCGNSILLFSLLCLCYKAAIKIRIILLEIILPLAIVYQQMLGFYSRKVRESQVSVLRTNLNYHKEDQNRTESRVLKKGNPRLDSSLENPGVRLLEKYFCNSLQCFLATAIENDIHSSICPSIQSTSIYSASE